MSRTGRHCSNREFDGAQELAKARKDANAASREAHDDTKYAGPKFVTAGKPKHTTPTVKD